MLCKNSRDVNNKQLFLDVDKSGKKYSGNFDQFQCDQIWRKRLCIIAKVYKVLPIPVALSGTTRIKCVSHSISVTRLGDLLDFGPLFKAFGNN